MFTASHNHPQYNGLKFCRAMAVPINEDTGLQKIKTIIEKNKFKKSKDKGRAIKKSILNGLNFDAIGYKILLEILVKKRGIEVKEVPYTFQDRKFG